MAMFDCFWGQRSENASAARILLPLKISSKYVYGTENLQISTQDLIKTIMHLAIHLGMTNPCCLQSQATSTKKAAQEG